MPSSAGGCASNIDLTGAGLERQPDQLRAADVDLAHRRLDPGLRRFFVSRGASREQADDLSQSTWTVVWGAIREGKYDPARGALSTFVYAVALKVWLRERRRAARRPDPSEELAQRLLTHESDASDAAALAELLRRVREYLSDVRVGEEDRRVLRALSRGSSDRELARELGVAPSTAHGRRASALERLRRALFPDRGPSVAERAGLGGEKLRGKEPPC